MLLIIINAVTKSIVYVLNISKHSHKVYVNVLNTSKYKHKVYCKCIIYFTIEKLQLQKYYKCINF